MTLVLQIHGGFVVIIEVKILLNKAAGHPLSVTSAVIQSHTAPPFVVIHRNRHLPTYPHDKQTNTHEGKIKKFTCTFSCLKIIIWPITWCSYEKQRSLGKHGRFCSLYVPPMPTT